MNTTRTSEATLRFAAVGDLLLAPNRTEAPYPRDAKLISAELRAVLGQADLVFGNLECTLAGSGRHVPSEPRVVATPALVRAVRQSGFNMVTLANNHAFDCLAEGFQNLRRLLDEIGLSHFGAGLSLDEATAPAMLNVNGLRIAFLGAVDERSGPSHVATASRWGVAPLDLDRLTRQVRKLRSDVDYVVVSLHWGEERFSIPSPVQIDQARALVEAGASMVLGHHPHVLQGTETWEGAPIVYSLGNFIADEVYFSDGHAVRWNRTERTGCVLLADLGRGRVSNVRHVPTYDPGTAVELDQGGFGRRRIEKARRALARGVTLARYRREHLRVRTIKPALACLRWSRLRELRFGHVRKAVEGLLRAREAD